LRETALRLGRPPGTSTSFVDSFTEETFLKVEADELGRTRVSFHLYDSAGELAADSDGPRAYPNGTEIRAANMELLLLVPIDSGASICYRLYNDAGALLTCSDGLRTQIYGGVRMTGNKAVRGRPPRSISAD
jgi:hypothetical protein